MSKKSAHGSGFADDIGFRRNHNAGQIMPSKILADHEENHNRIAPYSLAEELPELAGHPAFADDRFCFRREEVLERVASFKKSTQKTRIKVTRTNTGMAILRDGYLRHAAGVWLEQHGELAEADLEFGLRVDTSPDAKTEEQRIAEVVGSAVDNEALPPTEIDMAKTVKQLRAMGVGDVEICDRLRMTKGAASERSKRNAVTACLGLLSLPVADQLAIREGRMSASAARKKGRKTGRGVHTGPRQYVKVTTIKKRLKGPKKDAPSRKPDTWTLLQIIAGDKTAKDFDDGSAEREWADWLTKEQA